MAKRPLTLTGEYVEREISLLKRANFRAGIYSFFGMNDSAGRLYDETLEKIDSLRDKFIARALAGDGTFYIPAVSTSSRLLSRLLDKSTGALIASL